MTSEHKSGTDSSRLKDRLSDAGSLGFESHTGRVTGSPFQVSGGISTLQAKAPGLQSTTQDIPSGPKRPLRVKRTTNIMCSFIVVYCLLLYISLSLSLYIYVYIYIYIYIYIHILYTVIATTVTTTIF